MKLLVAIDLSDASEIIIRHLKIIARAADDQIWLIHIAEPDPDFVGYKPGPQTQRDSIAADYHEEHQHLQKFAKELRSTGCDCTALLVQGSTVEKILDEATKLSVDMIVIGSHGKSGIYRLLVGSTSKGLLEQSSIPITVIPTRG